MRKTPIAGGPALTGADPDALRLRELEERAGLLVWSAWTMLPDRADKYRRVDHAVTLADGTVLRLVASIEVVE